MTEIALHQPVFLATQQKTHMRPMATGMCSRMTGANTSLFRRGQVTMRACLLCWRACRKTPHKWYIVMHASQYVFKRLTLSRGPRLTVLVSTGLDLCPGLCHPTIWCSMTRWGSIICIKDESRNDLDTTAVFFLQETRDFFFVSIMMNIFFASALALMITAVGSAARTFTVYNACPFTIWPAIFTDLNVAQNVPSHSTGWEAPARSKVSFTVPDNWKSGRIWGRRNCDFTTNPGPNSCLTGGCNGGLECDPHSGTGVPPATVAEWTLGDNGSPDWYDVSLVDGYNLPVRITNNVGCPVADCPVDLGPNCPAPLKGPFDSSGFPVGCKSACFANLDGNQGNSPNCCSGSFSTPSTCPSSGVAYYSYFKTNCPRSYAYAYDESSSTALWTCNSALKADYTLTFCP